MSDERVSVTVRIAGEEHTIRANADPDYTRRCADLVDERISEIRSRSGLIESHKAAILAALSIADELFQAQLHARHLEEGVRDREGELAARLRRVLEADRE